MRATAFTRRHLLLGYGASLSAAFAYGAAALVARKIVTDYSAPMVGTAFSMAFGTMIVAAMFHRQIAPDLGGMSKRAWLIVALTGGAALWGVSFWFLAMNEAPVVLVAPLTGIHPLVAIVLTHIFLQRLERVTWRTALGALILVVGVILIAVGRE